MKMSMVTLIAAFAGMAVFASSTSVEKSVTGLESVTDAGDDTNGGFWNVAGRTGVTVGEGAAAVGVAVSTACESSGFDVVDALDTRAFTWDESPVVPVRTDKGAFFLIVR